MTDKDRDEWFTNKELYMLINNMSRDFDSLRSEMRETRNVIKKYNGLREDLGEMHKEIDHVKDQVEIMKAEKNGKKSVGESIQKWGAWVFSFVTLIILIITTIL